MDGRDFVTPEDVKRVAVPVLAHRLSLTTEAWANGVKPESVVMSIVGEVAGPPAVGQRHAAAAEGT
jgi:MoxR-like ATPase